MENQLKRPAYIAIVGRPNVGKSTLFNRLIGKRKAVTANEAGTTRDRNFHSYQCNEYFTYLVDTGGLEHKKQENIEEDIQTQAKIAIQDADVIAFIVDGSQELTTDDYMAADILRKTKKPVILIANKCDNSGLQDSTYNLYELGFGEPVAISAIHRIGVDHLQHQLAIEIKKLGFKESKANETKLETAICIIGKPNAGKSSLVNALTDSEKVIVSDIAGTTRDPIDTELSYNDKKYTLIDTAGLRRRGKIEPGIEKFSALRCIQAIERSDVVVLLIDGNKGISSQDAHLAEHIIEHKKGCIIAINKIDLLEKGEEQRNLIIAQLKRRFAFIPWAKILFVSAKNKRNTRRIFDLTEEILVERNKRVHTADLNGFMQKITQKHLPTSAHNKKPKFMYATQADSNPPKFILHFKRPQNLHFSYPRYLENELRKEYGFEGTAISLIIKGPVQETTKS